MVVAPRDVPRTKIMTPTSLDWPMCQQLASGPPRPERFVLVLTAAPSTRCVKWRYGSGLRETQAHGGSSVDTLGRHEHRRMALSP